MKKRQRARAVASKPATKQSLLPSSLFDFDLKAFNLRSASSPKLKKSTVIATRRKPKTTIASPSPSSSPSISDLLNLVCSQRINENLTAKKKKIIKKKKTEQEGFLKSSKSFFDFDLKGFKNTSSSSSSPSPSPKLKKSTVIEARRTSVLTKPNIKAPSPAQKTVTSISDLKDLVSSRSASIKHHIETSYSDILKESEFSHSRISKKFKIHTQTCQQVVEEADKEYKKVSDLLTENVGKMKTSYAKIIKKVETSATHVCKTSIPEIAQSTEKAILSLRSHYGISN